MLFSEIIGQSEVKRHLANTVKNRRISHALLFTGPRGTGKLAMAVAYSQYMLCEDRNQDEPCGSCSACIKVAKLVHPDLHFVYPHVKTASKDKEKTKGKIKEDDTLDGKWRNIFLNDPYFTVNDWNKAIDAEKKQAVIYAETSEEIIKKLSFKAFEGEYKIMVIWLAEKMNSQASNKLLKILEEPPENTVFILISEEPELLLPTIRSRVQAIKFDKIDDESLCAAIKKKFNTGDIETLNIARLANGSFSEAALVHNSSEESDFIFSKFVEFMRFCYAAKIQELTTFSEEMAMLNRGRQKQFLVFCQRMIRENFMKHTAIEKLVRLTKKESEFSEKFYKFINSTNVIDLYNEFNSAHYHIDRNGNAKIVFLDLALKITRIFRSKSSA